MTIRDGMIPLVLLLTGAASVPAQQPPAPPPAAPPAAAALAQPPASQDKVGALKQSLQASLAALRHYEWVETTAISLKGEKKSEDQNRCYYGAEGTLQRVPLGGASDDGGKKVRGLRGKIAEGKKEGLSESMHEALALVKQYVPPDPAKIQAAKDAGRITLTPPDKEGRVKIVIKDYLKTGDSLSAEMDAATNRFGGIAVSSYTDKAKHAVVMNISFGAFADGTVYPAQVALDIKEEKLTVNIANTGYRKLGA